MEQERSSAAIGEQRRELCVRGKKGEERVAARGREW
jgi:hypothetical protein